MNRGFSLSNRWHILGIIILLTFSVAASAQTTTIKVVDAADQPVADLYVTLTVGGSSTATPAYTDDAGELLFNNALPVDVNGVKLEYKWTDGVGANIVFSDSAVIPNATYATTANTTDTPSYSDFASLTMNSVLWVKLDGYIQRGFALDRDGTGLTGVLVAADAGADGNTTGELVITTSTGTTELAVGEYMLLISTSWQGRIVAYDATYSYYAFLDFFTAEGNLEVMSSLGGYQNVSGQYLTKSLTGVNFKAGWDVSGSLTVFGGGSGTTAQVLADENNNGSWDVGEAVVTSEGASGGSWSFVLPATWSGEIIVLSAGYRASVTTMNASGVTYDSSDFDYNVSNLSGDNNGLNFEAPAGSGSVTVHLIDYAGNTLNDFTVKLGGVAAVSTAGTTAVVTVPSTNNVTFESLTILGYDLPRNSYLIDNGAGTGTYINGSPTGTLDFSTNSHLWIKINGYVGRGTLGGANNIVSNVSNTYIRELGGKYVVFFSYTWSSVYYIKAEASGRYYVTDRSPSGNQWSIQGDDINTFTFDMSGSGEGSGSNLNFTSNQTGAFTLTIRDRDAVEIINSLAQPRSSSANIGSAIATGSSSITGLDIDSISSFRINTINGVSVYSHIGAGNVYYGSVGGAFSTITPLAGTSFTLDIDGYILQGRVDDGSNRPLPDTVIRTNSTETGVWASDDMRYAMYLTASSSATRLYPTKTNATFTATETVQNGNWDDSIGGTNEYGLTIATLTSAHTRDFLGAADNLYGDLTVKLVDWNGDLINHLYVRLDNIGSSQGNAGAGAWADGTIEFTNISLDVERVTVGFANTTFTLDTPRGSYSHDSTNGVDGVWSNTVGAVADGSTLWVKLNGYIAYGSVGTGANSLVVSGGGADAAWGSEDNNNYAVFIPWTVSTNVTIKIRYYVNASTYYFYLVAADAAPLNAFTRVNDINTYTFLAGAPTKLSQQTGLDFHDTDRTMLYIRLLDVISDSELIRNFRVRLADSGGTSLRDATDGNPAWDADGSVNGVVQCSGVDVDSISQINLISVFNNSISLTPGANPYPEWSLNNDGGTVPSPFGNAPAGLTDIVVNEQGRHLWVKINGYIIQGSFTGDTPTITATDGDGSPSVNATITGNDYSIYVPATNQLATNAGNSNTAPITVKAERAGFIITTSGTGVPNRQTGTLTENGNKWEFDNNQVNGSPYNLDFDIPNISNINFVVINSSGVVVSNAQIRLNDNNAYRARDGDDGTTDGITRFTGLNLNSLTSVGVNLRGVTYLTPDEYSIDATATWTTTIPTLPDGNPTIYLKLSDDDILMLRGTVYDKPQADPTKVPMVGVTVTALGSNGSGNYTAVTDGSGIYEIPNVPKGWSGTLMATVSGYSFTPLDIPDLQENVSTDFFGQILDTGTDFKFFGEDPDSGFGYYTSMSCDGLKMVVGTYNGNKAYIFARASESDPWSFQRRLIPSNTVTGFGRSVAISPDGAVVIVGAPDSGRSYVYSLAAEGIGSWGAAAGDSLEESFIFNNTGGYSVRAWDDNAGNYTLFFGSPQSNEVYVYASSGGATFSLSATVNGIGPNFGYSLDISRDGNVLVVGATGSNVAYVYLRASGHGNDAVFDDGINDQLTTLTAAGSSTLGSSVALNNDGSVVVVGDTGHSSNKGAGFVFLAPGNDWRTAGGTTASSATLSDSGGAAGARLGHSSVISADGEFVIMGAPGEDKIVYFGGVWSGVMDPISVQTSDSGISFGTGLSMNCDGTTVVVGSPDWGGGRGTVEVFSTSTTYYIRGVIVDGSGSGPIQGVTLTAVTTNGTAPDTPVVTTGANGSYEIIVYRGWSGTITPVLSGYSFDPVNGTYANVFRNYCCENYTANLNELEITGTITDGNGIPLAGVAVNYGDTLSVVTNGAGEYTIPLPYGWTGVVRPYKAGYDFTPETRSYSSITLDQTSQNYTSALIPAYKITATAGKGGSITPAGTVVVYQGGSKSFFIAPAAGYKVSDVLVDGESQGALRSYSFSNVNANHTIHAMFSGKANGWLKVIIVPAEAVAEGAAWRVKGHDQWLPSGATLELPPGTYEIEFLDLPHWNTCCPVTATVYANKTTVVDDVVYKRIGGDARVHYFVADDYITTAAAGTNLKWMVTGAQEVMLSFMGEVDPEGETKVNPDRSTTYWLSAIDEARTIPGTVDIEVMQKPVIDWFITNAKETNPLHEGEKAIITWQTHGAENVELHKVDAQGNARLVAEASTGENSYTTTVEKTAKYLLIAENAVGEVQAELEVFATAEPRIDFFKADRNSIISGEKTKLRWLVIGADDVEITNISSNSKAKGRKTVSPLETTEYKLVASNSAGEVSQTITIKVEDSACDLAVQLERFLFDGFEVSQSYAGSEIVAELSIANHGEESAENFDVVIYEGKLEIARQHVKVVAAGKIKKLTIPFIPVKTGILNIIAVADPEKALADHDIKNNTHQVSFTTLENTLSELLIKDVEVKAIDTDEGKAVEIQFVLHNAGSKKADDFQVDVEVDGKLVFWDAVKTIDANNSIAYKTSAMISKKKVTIKILADRYNVIGEVNKGNNLWMNKVSYKNLGKNW